MGEKEACISTLSVIHVSNANGGSTNPAIMLSPLTLSLSLSTLIPSILASCPRDLLLSATDSYTNSQLNGLSGYSFFITPNTTYLENNITLSAPSQSLLATPLPVAFARSIHDDELCRTFTELTITEGGHPYVITTMLYLNAESERVMKVDSLVSDVGDWAFNATGHLLYTTKESWTSITPSLQLPRSTLQSAVDAYLDSWGNGSITVPYGTPCARLEGGSYTDPQGKGGNTCKMPEFPKPFYVSGRRYVVDVQGGAVGVMNDFPFLEKSRGQAGVTPSSNLVRVEGGGLIRYIHENTVCETRNCGR
jgi:hypothetical protein